MVHQDTAREQQFMKLLQDTLKQARRNGGRISQEEIAESFGSFELGKDQLDQITAYLQAHKIVVGTEVGGDEDLPEEERNFLVSYTEVLRDIPEVPDSVLDAIKISAMAGEKSAQRELSEQMLGKVVDIARLYSGQGVSLEDLVGAGNEALVTGVSFLGHLEGPEEVEGELGRRIMDSMEDLIAAMLDEKAFDRDVEDEVNLVADKARELAQTLGRKVSPVELAAEGEVTRDQIARAIRLTGGKIEDLDVQ